MHGRLRPAGRSNLPHPLQFNKVLLMNDFRSDVFTLPLPEMRSAIESCSWGDAVMREDDATNRFEERVAKLAGKEAGLFMVSGTMANQIGIKVNMTSPPESLICDQRAHVYGYEAAGIATFSQAMVTPIMPKNGVYLTLEDIEPRVIGEDQHFAPTKLICLENTLSGTIMPIEEIKRISEFARSRNIRMHLDGARLWNASAATGITIAEYCQYFDTVSLCFSKGLCAPVGSVLLGPKHIIHKAFLFRKQVGGSVRQSGWLCTAANMSIDLVFPRLAETHKRAAHLATELQKLGIELALPADTSFVVFDAKASGIDLGKFQTEAADAGLKVWGERLAVHYNITDDSVDKLINVFAKLKQN